MISKKMIASLLSALMLAGVTLSMNVDATVVNDCTTPSGIGHEDDFDDDWEEKWEAYLNIGGETVEVCARVGFDTWWTDEDYITKGWAPTGWEHYVKVSNNSGSESTRVVKGGVNTGKADYPHDGNTKFWIYVQV